MDGRKWRRKCEVLKNLRIVFGEEKRNDTEP